MKFKSPKIVVFADLDGTLLNESYDSSEVEPIIRQLLSLNVSIVLCSSKTKVEIEFYRRELGINDPFIVENGSSILIPKGYFQSSFEYTKQANCYHIIELGSTYSEVRKKLAAVKEKTAANIVGFGDMTAVGISRESGLPLHLARLAKKRQYDEPFKIVEGNEKEVLRAIFDEGLNYAKGGRYFHVLGNCDKGKATLVLKKLYLQTFSELMTIGVGDSPNDWSMLEVVDKPVLVKQTALGNENSKAWRKILNIAVESR